MKTTRKWERGIIFLILILTCVSLPVFADPSGASITSASTVNGPGGNASSRSDARGTITTTVLNSIQQDQHWKAYVGNVTGTLTLDNPTNYTIYSWDLTTVTGQVYASRYSNLSWSAVSCAPHSLLVSESTFHNMTDSNPDKINSTFNWSIHKQFLVGSNTIAQNSCNSTVTYINDTRPVPTTSSKFQEVLIQDANNYLIYMTSIDYRSVGYDNTTSTFDFQMIVAESDVKGSPTPYYFYVELR